MDTKNFTLGLTTLSSSLPYGKKITNEEALFLWMLLPADVKTDVTNEMWLYACTQRRLDPNPSQTLSVDMQLLSYLYRQRDGMPAFDWGLKEDLPQRMLNGGTFNPQVLPETPTQHPDQFLPVTNPLLKGAF